MLWTSPVCKKTSFQKARSLFCHAARLLQPLICFQNGASPHPPPPTHPTQTPPVPSFAGHYLEELSLKQRVAQSQHDAMLWPRPPGPPPFRSHLLEEDFTSYLITAAAAAAVSRPLAATARQTAANVSGPPGRKANAIICCRRRRVSINQTCRGGR